MTNTTQMLIVVKLNFLTDREDSNSIFEARKAYLICFYFVFYLTVLKLHRIKCINSPKSFIPEWIRTCEMSPIYCQLNVS